MPKVKTNGGGKEETRSIVQSDIGQYMKSVDLEFTERALYQFATNLYTDNRAFVRESLQNAIDSGAKSFSIDANPWEIRIKDDGSGMSKDFMIDRFNKVGDSFKSNDQLGQYGIGRLSLWLPLAEEVGKKIEYNGEVEIITKDGKNTTRVVWTKLPEYECKSDGDTTEHGTEIIIRKRVGELPSKEDILEYLKQTIVDVNIDISVNGAKVESRYGAPFTVNVSKRFENENAKRIFLNPNYDVEIGVDPKRQTIFVAERGLMLSQKSAAVGGYINFTEKNTSNRQETSIHTISRENLTINNRDIMKLFIEEGVILYYSQLGIKEREVQKTQMLESIATLYNISGRGSKGSAKELAEMVVHEGVTLKEWKSRGEIWLPNHYVEEWMRLAKEAGYKILVSDSSIMELALRLSGVKNGEDEVTKLANAHILLRSPESQAEQNAMIHFAGLISMFQEIKSKSEIRRGIKGTAKAIGTILVATPGVIYAFATGTAEATVDFVERAWHGEVDLFHSRSLSLKEASKSIINAANGPKTKFSQKGPIMKVGGVKIYLAESDDVTNVAFQISGKKEIGINVKNENVRTAIEMRRPDLLNYDILHEYVHLLGKKNHDDDFYSMFQKFSKSFGMMELITQISVLPPLPYVKTTSGYSVEITANDTPYLAKGIETGTAIIKLNTMFVKRGDAINSGEVRAFFDNIRA